MTDTYFVSPTDEARRQTWLDVFGADRLPVVDPRPSPGVFTPLVYDLDLTGISDLARARLAGFVSQNHGLPYFDAFDLVRDGRLSIPAVGLTLLSGGGA